MLVDALIVLLYIVIIIFVIALIVLCIKLIETLKKVDVLVENITRKAETLDGVFELVDSVSNKFGFIGETIAGYILGAAKKVFKRKKKESEE